MSLAAEPLEEKTEETPVEEAKPEHQRFTVEQLQLAKKAMQVAKIDLLDITKNKTFYGFFLLKMNTQWSTRIPTAGVFVNDKVNMIVNPIFFLELAHETRVELLEHEIKHIVYGHVFRSRREIQENGDGLLMGHATHKMMNYAQDAHINENLPALKEFGVSIRGLNNALEEKGSDQRLVYGDASEVHYTILRNELVDQDLLKKFKDFDDHGVWEEGTENSELGKAVVRAAANASARAAGKGSTPQCIQQALDILNKSQVNWRQEFQRFLVASTKYEFTRTRKKRNRRYGLLQQGRKKDIKAKVFFIGDESGSMSNEQVSQIGAELDKAIDLGHEIWYVSCDTEAGEPVKYEKGQKFTRTRSGGTYYGPGIAMALEHEADAIVFAGDFDAADTPNDPKIPFLWLGVNTNSSPPGNFGKTIYVETVK